MYGARINLVVMIKPTGSMPIESEFVGERTSDFLIFQIIHAGSRIVIFFHAETRGCFSGSKVTEVRFHTNLCEPVLMWCNVLSWHGFTKYRDSFIRMFYHACEIIVSICEAQPVTFKWIIHSFALFFAGCCV
jgi:hypothetical protein